MRFSMGTRVVVALGALLAAGSAFAGVTTTAIVGGGATSLFSPAIGTNSATQTITLTFNGNGGTNNGASLSALATAGANASDFAIVGGTCQPGTTVLSAGSPSCTVIVQYKASTAGTETAQLTGSCSTVGLAVGGFTLTCGNIGAGANTGPLTSLTGALLAALAPTPLLDPKMLTAFCALLLAVGVYFASRRQRT